LAKEFGYLPVRAARVGVSDPSLSFEDGSGSTVEYARTSKGEIYPKKLVEDKKKKAKAAGVIRREWILESLQYRPETADSELALVLPRGISVLDVDSDRKFTVGEPQDPDTAKFLALAPRHLRAATVREAAEALRTRVSGKNLPTPSDLVTSEESPPSSPSAGRFAIAGISILIAGFLVWLGLRRTVARP
jgi:hypothetical protein